LEVQEQVVAQSHLVMDTHIINLEQQEHLQHNNIYKKQIGLIIDDIVLI
jgi:hypothetical protein